MYFTETEIDELRKNTKLIFNYLKETVVTKINTEIYFRIPVLYNDSLIVGIHPIINNTSCFRITNSYPNNNIFYYIPETINDFIIEVGHAEDNKFYISCDLTSKNEMMFALISNWKDLKDYCNTCIKKQNDIHDIIKNFEL